MTEGGRPGPLFDDSSADEAEAQRLNEALDTLASGGQPDIDPREDPALAELVQTATVLNHLFIDATEAPSFESYRERSRAAILHRLERRPIPITAEHRRRFRARLASVLAPVAAAAAAAAITFMAVAGGGLGLSGARVEAPRGNVESPQSNMVMLPPTFEASGPLATESAAATTNQTPRSIDEQLVRLRQSLAQIAKNAQDGQPVEADLLRQVTEDNASVQHQIDTQPEKVSPDTVAQYAQAAGQGSQILNQTKAAPGGEGALTAAQITAKQGVVTAARYFADRPNDIPADINGSPTRTPTATGAAPAPTAPPTISPTVTAP